AWRDAGRIGTGHGPGQVGGAEDEAAAGKVHASGLTRRCDAHRPWPPHTAVTLSPWPRPWNAGLGATVGLGARGGLAAGRAARRRMRWATWTREPRAARGARRSTRRRSRPVASGGWSPPSGRCRAWWT